MMSKVFCMPGLEKRSVLRSTILDRLEPSIANDFCASFEVHYIFIIFYFTKKKIFPNFHFHEFYPLVPGYDYSACGNSTSKKDSQANAAKDFIQYLLRQGQMLPNEVPDGCGMDQGGGAASGPPPMGGLGLNQRPVFQHG